MVLTPSTMLPLGTRLPSFSLPDFDGRTVSTDDFAEAPALLVAFICGHCPFVTHIRKGFADFAREYQPRGLAIGNMPVEQHPHGGCGFAIDDKLYAAVAEYRAVGQGVAEL